jgi:16S rRNA (cytidine1402-2'-O)-methyltransferase
LTEAERSGCLVLVATPIGNLEDLSPRAVRVLAEADVIACEDTRHTRRLLSHAGVSGRPLLAVHDHNEAAQTRRVLGLVDSGQTVAVVSDAGMPGISDPGARLAGAVAASGARVTVVPGPSAALAALVVSGLPAGRFCFEGFLPRRGAERRRRLEATAAERRTTVVYESPHRLEATLADLVEHCGPKRRVAVVRELTKLHEEVWRGTLADALDRSRELAPRGEHVIVVAGAPEPAPPADDELEADLLDRVADGRSWREAVSEVAEHLGVPRRRVYDRALKLRQSHKP